MASEEEKEKWSKGWEYEDLKRTLSESTDSALRSARTLHRTSSTHLRTFKDFIPQLTSRYHSYEHAFFNKLKDELASARDHPAVAGGVAVIAALLIFRGPRRLLLRNTLGRLQSEEAQFNRAERNVRDLGLSVDLMKKESKKLLERVALAEKEVKHGHQELMSAGYDVQRLAKSVYKTEARVTGLMDELRELPGREALKLRADVASLLSVVKQQRNSLDKRIMKISELGVAV